MAENATEALNAAWDEVEGEGAHVGEEGFSSPEPSPESSDETTTEGLTETTGESSVEEAPARASQTTEGDKVGEQEKAGKQEEGETARAAKAEKVPPSLHWGAAAAEHWSELPDPVKQQILKREKDIERKIQENGRAANLGKKFADALRPYQQVLQMEGADPVTAVANLGRVSQTLRMGTPQEKAQTVASIIKDYAVDIATLDTVLSAQLNGQPVPQQSAQPNIQEEVQRALQPMLEQQRNQQRQRTQQELSAFAKKAEFFPYVRQQMATIMEVGARNGQQVSLAEAYKQACIGNREVQQVLMKRSKERKLLQGKKAAETRQNAASTVRGAPSGGTAPTAPTTTRGALEQAWDAASMASTRI